MTFLECDRTWVAIRALGAGPLKVDAALTASAAPRQEARFPGHQVLRADGAGGAFCGLAVEVGEQESHGSFRAVPSRRPGRGGRPQRAAPSGVARYKSSDGKWLGIHWNDDPLDLGVWRNGERRDLGQHAAHLYDSEPIRAGWGAGS